MNPPPSKHFRPPDRNRIRIDGTMDPLDGIQVQIEEKGKRASPYLMLWHQKEMIREMIPCSNALCFDGGFSLGDLLRELVNNQQHNFIGTNFCRGREGDPERGGPRPSCETRFLVEVKLSFR